MKDDTQRCHVCDDPLDSPLARARGAHESCLEKSDGDGSGGGYVEK